MNKINHNLIIGSGVLGAYLSKEILKKKEKVIVASRSLKKKFKNYSFLNIHNQIKFEKLNIKNKKEIIRIIKKYNPDKIYYFSGQSSLTKSYKLRNQTYISHYIGVKNFLDVMKENKLKFKFFKANSGYIFSPRDGFIKINSKFSSNKNPYIQSQQKTFKMIKSYRRFGLKTFNLVFMQIESPLRDNNFFIKKVCLSAKNKKKITVGNLNTFRDYSWITEIVKIVKLISESKPQDIILSAGKKISGKEILNIAYGINKLNYKKYFFVSNKYYRKNEKKILISHKQNNNYLQKKYGFKFKIYGKKLIKKMYNNI